MPPKLDLPRVSLASAGGTITAIGNDRLHMVDYLDTDKWLTIDELLQRVPEVQNIAKIRTNQLAYPIFDVGPDNWLKLHKWLTDILGEGPDGLVVTHGTSFMEETAYFMHLTLKTEVPVVFVGALRPATALMPDGDLNLVNGIRVAVSPTSRGMGVLTCLNDEINSARDVTKTITYRVQTFQSRDLGFLGYADADGQVVYYRRPLRRHTINSEFELKKVQDLPRVDIIMAYGGADGSLVEAAVERGAKGIVTAGVGAGAPTSAMKIALDWALQQGIPVVESSRVGSGRVLPTPKRKRQGFIAADTLSPQKARILLMLALTRTIDPNELQRMFLEY
jgi:L-asparaginase